MFESEPKPGADVVEDAIAIDGTELSIVRPRDSEDLLDEEAFEREELLPYWAELWPSALALARTLAGRSLRGARTLELGCGLGLPSIVAAHAGARVVATDWSAEALAFARANAARNGAAIETLECSWAQPAPIVDAAPWDLVLASDVLYERRGAELLLGLLPRLVDERGEVLIADPGRPPAASFLTALEGDWRRESRSAPGAAAVTIHRLARRAA